MNIENLGVPQIANRAFVALAVEAGIETTIKSLVGLAKDRLKLLIELKTALAVDNPPLAEALNTQTLDAILRYMSSLPNSPIILADELPVLLNQNGPASINAARDGGVNTQVNITFSQPPEGFSYEIYLDGVFQKRGSLGANGWTNEAISTVPPGAHVLRVLFVRESDGAITRFSKFDLGA